MDGGYYLAIKVQAEGYPTYDVSCSDTTTDLAQVQQMVDDKFSDAIGHISGYVRKHMENSRVCRYKLARNHA